LPAVTANQRAVGARRTAAELEAILRAADEALSAGATALDAVVACVLSMEDSGVFNAGRGAVGNQAGVVQLDAAVMEGHTGRAGAVAAVSGLRNPVQAARLVMEQSGHVLLVGSEAERYASERGAVVVDAGYFSATDQLRVGGDTDTVGAVALDRDGHLAAATSTGGMRGKLPGRVGDSPVIGAGTYANERVAVSGTGQGEYFMRLVLAHDVAAVMAHRGYSVGQAVEQAIRERLGPAGGYGGLIAVDCEGDIAMAMNTSFMPRGWVSHERAAVVQTGG
jgi:beta-aspartyl-peptidase (threonine type)